MIKLFSLVCFTFKELQPLHPYYFLAVILGFYVVLSTILLCKPLMLHKKKRPFPKCSHISHRGGCGEKLENTISAFRNAALQYTDMFEIDVQLTKDGKVVIAHDEHLNRICNVEGNQRQLISDTNFDDLPQIKNSLEVEFHQGFVYENVDAPQRFLTLQNLLDEFPHILLNIDIKTDNDKLIEQTEVLIRQSQRVNTVVWGSSEISVTRKLRKTNCDIRLFFPFCRVIVVFIFFVFGLLPFIPIHETHLEVPYPVRLDKRTWKLRIKSFLLMILSVVLYNRLFIGHLKKRGIQIYFWVLNTEEEFASAFAAGADGVMTDFPTALTNWQKRELLEWCNTPGSDSV